MKKMITICLVVVGFALILCIVLLSGCANKGDSRIIFKTDEEIMSPLLSKPLDNHVVIMTGFNSSVRKEVNEFVTDIDPNVKESKTISVEKDKELKTEKDNWLEGFGFRFFMTSLVIILVSTGRFKLFCSMIFNSIFLIIVYLLLLSFGVVYFSNSAFRLVVVAGFLFPLIPFLLIGEFVKPLREIRVKNSPEKVETKEES